MPPYTFVYSESIKDISEYFFSSRAFFLFVYYSPFLFLLILPGRGQLCSLTDSLPVWSYAGAERCAGPELKCQLSAGGTGLNWRRTFQTPALVVYTEGRGLGAALAAAREPRGNPVASWRSAAKTAAFDGG